MNQSELINIGIGILIGLALAYFFWCGQSYFDLKQDYNQCKSDLDELNQNNIQLQEETKELLKKYELCEDKATFINVVRQLSTISKMARLLALI